MIMLLVMKVCFFRITETVFSKVCSAMSEYLSIAEQRMVNIAKYYSKYTVTSKRVHKEIQRLYGSDPKALLVLDNLAQLQQRRRLELSVKMDRLELAQSLTHVLTYIENQAGIFLIKPIFSTVLDPKSLITPISRPLPIKRTALHKSSLVQTSFPSENKTKSTSRGKSNQGNVLLIMP